MRRWYFGIGLVSCVLAVFSACFILLIGGLEGRKTSPTWTKDLELLGEHIPFFFFFGSAVVGIFYLVMAYQASRLAESVTFSPGYIDFDQIRGNWLNSFLGSLFSFVKLLIFAVLFGLVVLGLNKVVRYFIEAIQKI